MLMRISLQEAAQVFKLPNQTNKSKNWLSVHSSLTCRRKLRDWLIGQSKERSQEPKRNLISRLAKAHLTLGLVDAKQAATLLLMLKERIKYLRFQLA